MSRGAGKCQRSLLAFVRAAPCQFAWQTEFLSLPNIGDERSVRRALKGLVRVGSLQRQELQLAGQKRYRVGYVAVVRSTASPAPRVVNAEFVKPATSIVRLADLTPRSVARLGRFVGTEIVEPVASTFTEANASAANEESIESPAAKARRSVRKAKPPEPAIRITTLDDLPAVLKVAEVAALLRTTPAAIYTRLARDELPGFFRDGRRLRFHRDVLLKWLRKRASSPGS